MTYKGAEKRKYPRVGGNFIVYYRIFEEDQADVDMSQTKDLGLGGMYLTTNRQFSPGVKLALTIRLPFDPDPIMLIGKVVESCEVTKNLIYDTRIEFLAIDEKHRATLKETVDFYFKRGHSK